MLRILPILLLAGSLASCSSPQRTSTSIAEGSTAPASGPPRSTTTQPEAPTQSATPIQFHPLRRVPRGEQHSLGRVNKPNGWEQRYRRFVASGTPAYVPLELDGLSVAITELTDDGWLAFYESGFAELGPNRSYRAVLFDARGDRKWDVDLNRFLSRPDQLEIQDVRYASGKLYFNEACQSYARDAQDRCSSLVRLDPAAEQVDWRTPPLTSSDIILLHGPYVIAGYGFTNEADHLYLVDRESGRVVAQAPLDTAHDYLQVEGNTVWVVTTQSAYLFRLPTSQE